MVFKIDYTDSFTEDFERAINYISKELCNHQAAKDLKDKIKVSLPLIKEFPYSCPIVPNAFIPQKQLRRKVINNYSLFYEVDEKRPVMLLRLVAVLYTLAMIVIVLLMLLLMVFGNVITQVR